MTPVTWSTYDGVRDDVAPWLREVPAEWRFEKAKWFLSYCKQLNDHGTIDNVLSLTLRGVVNNDPDNPEGLVPKDYRTYQVFEAGDLVFKLIDLENVRTSRVGLVHERGIMSSAYIRVVPSAQWNPRFLYYFYFHLYEAEVFNKIGSGVRSTLGQADLLDLPIPVIGRDIQDKIVGFLDEKCAKVDEAVRIKEEQIALLRERRQILIQEAVTRGLNPNAPMKDSGIDWIGEIPAHWERRKIRHLFDIGRGRVIPREELVEGGKYPVFSSQTKNEGVFGYLDTFDFDTDQLTWTTDGANAGSVFRRRGRHNCTNVCGTLRPKSSELDLGFCVYAVGHAATFYKRPDTNGAKIMNEEMAAIEFPLPAFEEQVALACRIDIQTREIDNAVSIKESQISALIEYKTTLINAAVTGKIKVA